MIRKEPFGVKANSELPRSDWTIPLEELDTRRDFRKDPATCIFSVDPPGCVDVDDALSVKKLESGGYEIGVHIADVSFFVREKSALDAEGRARGTTVYLPNERIDMLPEILSANLCSLLEGQDRLAVSCVWLVDEDCALKGNPGFVVQSFETESYRLLFGASFVRRRLCDAKQRGFLRRFVCVDILRITDAECEK